MTVDLDELERLHAAAIKANRSLNSPVEGSVTFSLTQTFAESDFRDSLRYIFPALLAEIRALRARPAAWQSRLANLGPLITIDYDGAVRIHKDGADKEAATLYQRIDKLKHNLAAATDRIAELEKDRGSLLATEKGLTPAGERIARLEAALEQANAALRDAQSFVNIEQHRAVIDAARKEPT